MFRFIIMILVVIPIMLVAQGIDLSSINQDKAKKKLKAVDAGGSILDDALGKAVESFVENASSSQNDLRTSCEAQIEYGVGWCSKISDSDLRISCEAQTSYGVGWCSKISSKDLQYSCQAQTEYGVGWCSKISDSNSRNDCQAQTSYGVGWCSKIK